MKSIEIRLPRDFDKSFVVFKEKGKHFPCPMHYHPEYELVLVQKSTGRRMVGDSIGYFQEGDLVCMGPNLPHVWLNDPIFMEGKAGYEAEAVVIHFKEDFLGDEFFHIPEIDPLRHFLELSRRGMAFHGKTREHINELMVGMVHMNGIQRISALLSIFDILSQTREFRLLANPGFDHNTLQRKDQFTKIKEYIHQNFNKSISLPHMAEKANMAITTFCNFFKGQYSITFVEYLNSVRIGHACKLLSETDLYIVEIAFECGFNNLANFNRQFKKYKEMTPTQYRKILSIPEMA